MRKLIVAEQISLDGVIQSPGGPKEDPSGDFRLGGWVAPYADEVIGQALQGLLSQPFELLLGRRTYEIFAAYWPHVRADSASHAIADLFNSVPKQVATLDARLRPDDTTVIPRSQLPIGPRIEPRSSGYGQPGPFSSGIVILLT